MSTLASTVADASAKKIKLSDVYDPTNWGDLSALARQVANGHPELYRHIVALGLSAPVDGEVAERRAQDLTKRTPNPDRAMFYTELLVRGGHAKVLAAKLASIRKPENKRAVLTALSRVAKDIPEGCLAQYVKWALSLVDNGGPDRDMPELAVRLLLELLPEPSLPIALLRGGKVERMPAVAPVPEGKAAAAKPLFSIAVEPYTTTELRVALVCALARRLGERGIPMLAELVQTGFATRPNEQGFSLGPVDILVRIEACRALGNSDVGRRYLRAIMRGVRITKQVMESEAQKAVVAIASEDAALDKALQTSGAAFLTFVRTIPADDPSRWRPFEAIGSREIRVEIALILDVLDVT